MTLLHPEPRARLLRRSREEEGCAGLRDGLVAERESPGARRGDQSHDTENHPAKTECAPIIRTPVAIPATSLLSMFLKDI
jgi:hypothetical protein